MMAPSDAAAPSASGPANQAGGDVPYTRWAPGPPRKLSLNRNESSTATGTRTSRAHRAPLCKNCRSVLAAAVGLSVTASLSIGYSLGFGPAAGGQINSSLDVPGRLQLLVLTSVFIGMAAGAALAGLLAGLIGRRRALLACALPALIGWPVFTLARASPAALLLLPMLFGGRIAVGLSAGGLSVCVPLYVAEVAPAPLRGALVALHQFGIGLGFTLAYVVGWAATDASTGEAARTCVFCGWRIASWTGLAPVVLAVAVAAYLPESPQYLASRGRPEEARRALRWLRGSGQPTLLEAEEAELLAASERQTSTDGTGSGEMKARLFVALLVLIATQLAGGYDSFVTPMEARKLRAGWDKLGLGDIPERPETLILCAAALLCLLLGAVLVEPLGRRKLFISCAALSAVSTTLMAVAFGVPQLDRTFGHKLLLSIGVCGYVLLYNLGLAPISWVIVSEVFPLRGRGALMGITIGKIERCDHPCASSPSHAEHPVRLGRTISRLKRLLSTPAILRCMQGCGGRPPLLSRSTRPG
eukprot:SAG22_NODE_667_length_8010_cov_2.289091_5_plen_529_part_00